MFPSKVLFVVASDGFQYIEYSESKNVVTAAGVTVTTASDRSGGAVAHDGSTIPVDINVLDADMVDYDGIFLIGGPGALACLNTPEVYRLISQAHTMHKAYGAICVSTRILAKAWVLKGIRATGWNGDNALAGILQGYGAIFDDKPMITDHLVVTARDPKAAALFGEGIVRVLTKRTLAYTNQ